MPTFSWRAHLCSRKFGIYRTRALQGLYRGRRSAGHGAERVHAAKERRVGGDRP